MRNKSDKSGIYEILNIVTNDYYIGQAVNLRERKNKHFSLLRKNEHSNSHLQNAFNKYKEESFEFVILLYCESFELTRYEQELVNRLHPAYNILTICVDSPQGTKHTEETKRRLSEMQKGTHRSEESNKRRSESLKGYKNPNFGKDFSEIHRQRIADAQTGIPSSEKTKRKQSKSAAGRKNKNSKSKYVGVFFVKNTNKWGAIIQYRNIVYFLGYFDYEIEAALVYNEASLNFWGWKAKLNNISQEEINNLWEML